jgi:hypothetical protein
MNISGVKDRAEIGNTLLQWTAQTLKQHHAIFDVGYD